ncbi:EcsC family protein [Roseobacter sp. HKCCA0434]|uniref:EcsC family protein n=1 Tax=Roseobacter sp. HKCCA0434 TaxID=3079297 RepID=UPI002905A3A5|nr:EcsC family protein [Roseobacter sp. HKCCA0434]
MSELVTSTGETVPDQPERGIGAERLRAIIAEQSAYRAEKPAILPRFARSVTRPAGWLASRLIPVEAIELVLTGANMAANLTLRRALVDHDFSDLAACDEAADVARRWAIGYGMTSGGAAGAAGGIGLVVDVPTSITLAMRTARAVGLAYGFGESGEAERAFVLNVLSLAGANDREQKERALRFVDRINSPEAIQDGDYKAIAQMGGPGTASVAAIRKVAEQLGVNLGQRKAGQLVPLFGAVIGATVNAAFLSDVALAAKYAYRERWLSTRGYAETAESDGLEGSTV